MNHINLQLFQNITFTYHFYYNSMVCSININKRSKEVLCCFVSMIPITNQQTNFNMAINSSWTQSIIYFWPVSVINSNGNLMDIWETNTLHQFDIFWKLFTKHDDITCFYRGTWMLVNLLSWPGTNKYYLCWLVVLMSVYKFSCLSYWYFYTKYHTMCHMR